MWRLKQVSISMSVNQFLLSSMSRHCRPFPERKKHIFKDIFHSEVNKLVISYCLRKWADDEDDKKNVRSKYDEKWLDMIEINIFIYIWCWSWCSIIVGPLHSVDWILIGTQPINLSQSSWASTLSRLWSSWWSTKHFWCVLVTLCPWRCFLLDLDRCTT